MAVLATLGWAVVVLPAIAFIYYPSASWVLVPLALATVLLVRRLTAQLSAH